MLVTCNLIVVAECVLDLKKKFETFKQNLILTDLKANLAMIRTLVNRKKNTRPSQESDNVQYTEREETGIQYGAPNVN